jgi:bleomycin hydrolase
MRRVLFFVLSFHFFSFCYSQELTVEELQLKVPQKLLCTPVKDQAMSSTCWSFASNSQIESELLREGKKPIDLSEMFIARYSYLRKIYQHLKLKGSNFFTPGGQFHDVMWVVKNYGMMPESAYNGKARGELNHDHSDLDTVIKRYADKLLRQGKPAPDSADLVYLNTQFDKYLGKIPVTFIYNNKRYTAKTFAGKELGFNPDDYVEITSYTHHPFYKPFVLEDKYNWTLDQYYNVPVNDFSRITDSALDNRYTVGWDGDADDPYFKYFEGLAYLPGTIKDFQKERQAAFEDQSTLLNHMMQIVASVKDKHGRKWYYIKNSWGDYSNGLGGYLFMRDDYFKIRTVAIIVNKKAIPADIRRRLGI